MDLGKCNYFRNWLHCMVKTTLHVLTKKKSTHIFSVKFNICVSFILLTLKIIQISSLSSSLPCYNFISSQPNPPPTPPLPPTPSPSPFPSYLPSSPYLPHAAFLKQIIKKKFHTSTPLALSI